MPYFVPPHTTPSDNIFPPLKALAGLTYPLSFPSHSTHAFTTVPGILQLNSQSGSCRFIVSMNQDTVTAIDNTIAYAPEFRHSNATGWQLKIGTARQANRRYQVWAFYDEQNDSLGFRNGSHRRCSFAYNHNLVLSLALPHGLTSRAFGTTAPRNDNRFRAAVKYILQQKLDERPIDLVQWLKANFFNFQVHPDEHAQNEDGAYEEMQEDDAADGELQEDDAAVGDMQEDEAASDNDGAAQANEEPDDLLPINPRLLNVDLINTEFFNTYRATPEQGGRIFAPSRAVNRFFTQPMRVAESQRNLIENYNSAAADYRRREENPASQGLFMEVMNLHRDNIATFFDFDYLAHERSSMVAALRQRTNQVSVLMRRLEERERDEEEDDENDDEEMEG